MPRPVPLGFSGPWKAVDVPATIGTASASLPDFDTCLQKLGTTPKDSDLLNRMLYNKVRVCPNCNKPNGFTMRNCNACGTDISTQSLSKTLNVFSGFMLGIAKSTFPLKISLRSESKTSIVFDDLLALSPAHINVIPTKQFIPDWRYLLRRPAEGTIVAQTLAELAQATVKEQFLADKDWVGQSTNISDATPSDVAKDLGMGFNFPPSQNQLHLQCIFPVVLPYQYYLYERKTHFSQGRFFPVEYVVEVLKAATEKPLPAELLQDETAIEDIVAYFSTTHGIDAEKMRLAFVERFEKNYNKFQKWPTDRFSFVAKHDTATSKLVIEKSDGSKAADEEQDSMKLVNADKLTLQNYGRPYDAETGKPTGKFYQFPATHIENDIEFW